MQDYMIKIVLFSLFPSRLRMRPHSCYRVSCLVLVSFLLGAAKACWDPNKAPDYAEMTKDYALEVGSDLVLNCTLTRTNLTKEHNRYVSSSDLLFERESINFSAYSRKIDNMTLQLTIPKAKEENSGLYLCKMLVNGTKHVICGSKVSVGYPPHHVSNFTCLNRNYETLRCTWNTKKNNVITKYTIVKYLMGNTFPQKCPNAIDNSCEWSRNEVGFLIFGESISFTITGKNDLGNSTDDFIVNTSAIVITNKPENFHAINVSNQFITVTWNSPRLSTSDTINLRFQIWLSYESEILVYDAGINTSKFTISNLIPYILYNVSIRCRSLGTEKEDMWSPFAFIEVKTPADVPYKIPETIPEAYELHYYQESKSVSLYWKNIPDLFHNGEKFHYHIKYSKKILKGTSHVLTVNSTSPFIEIKDLQRNAAYIFHLYSANENGLSEDYNSIYVAVEDEILPAPKDVRVISLDFGLYNLSWNPPNDGDTFHYIIFWCSNLKPWKNGCDNSIYWFNESLQDTNKILNITDLKTNFQFAVVSKIENRSSGMQWASCIAPQKGGIDKIKYVLVVPKTSTSLNVIWKLDCPSLKAIVKKYEITYCRLHECNVIQVESDSEEFLLENLHPFSNYSVRIRAINNENSKSENSDPVYQTTLAGAPSGSPQNIKIYSNSSKSFIISWIPPAEPNGVITKYIVSFNGSTKFQDAASSINEYILEVDGLKPYSIYAVQIEACVNTDCSVKSETVMIRTGVDVPGYMDPPRVEEVNSTHFRVSWTAPVSPNGPINFYTIKWQAENQSDTSHPHVLEVPGVNSVILDVKCPVENEDGVKYLFYIRSANMKNYTKLFGPFSNSTQARACHAFSGKEMYIGIVSGASIGGIIAIFVIYKLYVWIMYKIKQVNSIKIRLPEGLEGPETNPLNNYEYFKNGLNGNIPGNNNERLSYIIDENKNRHGSGSSQFSNSSTEELIFKNGKCMKFGRKPSGDSSGCSSMSSNATPRIQLSSDSGTESDFAVPPSPDSAITEQSLHNPHKSPLPILMEVHDQTSLEKQSLQNEFSPEKKFHKHRTATDGMILKVDPPYSKFGIAGNSTSSVNPLAFYSYSLANSEPSMFDAQKPEQPDTSMAPYSKVGLAKSSGDLLGMSNVKQMGYSKFGFPTIQKRFSVPSPNLNPIAVLLLENPDRYEWPNIKNTLDDDCGHSKRSKETSINIPSSDLVEDCGYIKFGRGNLCPKTPSHGYVPFHDLKSQMEHSPVNTTDQMKDVYDTSKTDKNEVEFPGSTDWTALNHSEGENSSEDTPEVLFDVPFLLNSTNSTTIEDGIYNSNNSSLNLPCSQNSNESLTKIPSESDMKCSSESSTSSDITNENNPFLQDGANHLTDVNVLYQKDNPIPEESHFSSSPIKTNNYGIPNEVIVNPVTLKNGYVPFHSLTESVCDRTLNHLPKVTEPNVPRTVFSNGICTGSDNYLTSNQKGNCRLLKDDVIPKTVSSVLTPIRKTLSNTEKPVQKGNGYSSLSLKYILKPLPKMESEICEV